MKYLALTILLALHFCIQGCSLVSDPENSNTNEINDSTLIENRQWTKADGKYYLQNEFQIQSGDTLIVPPGVEIRFCGGIYIERSAALILNGTKEKPVSLLWMGPHSSSRSCDFSINVSGSFISRNAYISGPIYSLFYNESQTIELDHVTWVISELKSMNANRQINDDPKTEIDERSDRFNMYAPTIKITNSVISTFPNEPIDSTIHSSWFHVDNVVIDPKSIEIRDNCIEDATPNQIKAIYNMKLLNEEIYGYTSIFGNNIIGRIQFEYYPLDDKQQFGQPENWNLSVKNDENCKRLGAEN